MDRKEQKVTDYNENKRKEDGAIWFKESQKTGEAYLSGIFEIDGIKHSFVAFKNKYKTPDDNKPSYKIFLKNKKEEESPF